MLHIISERVIRLQTNKKKKKKKKKTKKKKHEGCSHDAKVFLGVNSTPAKTVVGCCTHHQRKRVEKNGE